MARLATLINNNSLSSYSIDDLNDVIITSSAAGELLFTNGPDSWVNYTLTEAGIASVSDLANYVGLTGSQTITGDKTFSGTTISDVNVNAQTGTTYTTVLADSSSLITMDNASANTVTIPLNSSVAYRVGTVIMISQIGAGATTIAATGGVTLSTEVGLILNAQYAMASLVKIATDQWLVTGSLKAA